MQRLLDAARAGRGGALVVRGEPGIGKSAVLEVARRRAAGMTVLAATAGEGESELPHAGLSQLLAPVIGLRERLPERQRTALEGALALGPASGDDRFAAYVAVVGLIAEAARPGPLLVLVDDAHWLDTASAEALRFLARRVADDPVALLVAARVGERVGFAAPHVPELGLTGLGAEAAAELLQARSGARVADAVARQLWEATAGNPLALGELARRLTPAALAGREPLDDPLPVGRDVEALFRSELAVLPERARRAVVVAATGTAARLPELLAALAALGLDERDLELAEDAGVLRLRDAALAFRHPLMRTAAYHGASRAERRAAHRALGEALAGHAPDESARHLAAATSGHDEALADRLHALAEHSRARGAPVAAARLFTDAARLTPPGRTRGLRQLEASRDLGVAGRYEQALALLDDAARTTGDDPRMRADVAHVRARTAFMYTAPQPMLDLLVREADRVAPLDPVRAAAMRIDANFMAHALARPREALRLAELAYPDAQRAGGAVAPAAACVLASALVLAGRRPEALPLLRAAGSAVDAPDALVMPMLAASLGHFHLWAGEPLTGRTLLLRVVDHARSAGAVAALPYALACLSDVQLRLGDWLTAFAVATESVALADELGQRSELANSLVRLAAVEAGRGREDACRAHLRRAYELAGQLGIDSMYTLGGAALGLLELGLGRLPEAIAALEETGRRARSDGLREPAVAPWAQELAEAYVRAGERAAAERVVAELDELARASDSPSALAGVARCRGLLAGEDDFEGQLLDALRRHDALGAPFERARTELCLGERLRRAGRRIDARERFRAALATVEHLGAAPWAERAARELAATGERVGPRRTRDRDALTGQELQVALAVAEGRTNRELAALLFVSPKTVEAHLSRIYRKLGIRSRAELTRVVLTERR